MSNSKRSDGVVEEDLTVLQKHVAFFDRDQDGIVYPRETFQGFRAIGANILLSTVAAVLINVALSSKTRDGKWSLSFPIEIKHIKKAKHKSDSEVYDLEGRFDSSKFEEIFAKYAHTRPDALTSQELGDMLKANRVPKDLAGRIMAWTEWRLLYLLCKDKKGFLERDVIRGVFDGSLFEKMEAASARNKHVS